LRVLREITDVVLIRGTLGMLGANFVEILCCPDDKSPLTVSNEEKNGLVSRDNADLETFG